MAKSKGSLEAELVGEEKVEAWLNKYSEQTNRELKNHVNGTALEVQTLARKNLSKGSGKLGTPAVDVGRLRTSIQIKMENDGLTKSVGTDLEYAAAVEHGAAPHFPPPDALAGWANRHGFATDKGTLFVLARDIANNPQPARPFLFPAFEQVKGDFQSGIRTIVKKG